MNTWRFDPIREFDRSLAKEIELLLISESDTLRDMILSLMGNSNLDCEGRFFAFIHENKEYLSTIFFNKLIFFFFALCVCVCF